MRPARVGRPRAELVRYDLLARRPDGHGWILRGSTPGKVEELAAEVACDERSPPTSLAERAIERPPPMQDVYALLMLNERLQILVSLEQRRRLEREAARRCTSVAALVREAIDAQYGSVSRSDREEALAEIRAMRGTYHSPEELEQLIDEEHDGAGARRRA